MAKSKFNLAEKLGAPVSNLNTPSMQIVEIPLDKLLDNEGNFFKVEDVQELVDDIEMRGLENPLTVCEAENGYYRIVAGHRRRKALEQIGKLSAPCFVKAYADADSEEVALIQSNLTARELTYYEKMLAVVRLGEALRRMKENGVELPGRLRDHLAEKSGESASAVHRMTYIYKHLSPELLEGLRQEKINESIAYELASSPKTVQTEFEQRLARGETFRAQDVKAARDKPTVSDGVVDAFLLRHIAQGHEAALYRVLHDSQFMTVKWLIEEVKDALFFRGYMGHDSEGAQYVLTISGLEVKRPFQGKLTWPQIVQRLRGMVESGKIAPSEEPEPTPEEQAVQEFADGMQKAVSESPLNHACCTGFSPSGHCGAARYCDKPYSCCSQCNEDCNLRCGFLPKERITVNKVWHPYPAEKPDEGQTVLALSHSKYNRDNYAAYIFRAGGWYLPELPEDGLVTPDVRWWSAELAPAGSESGE